MAAFETTIQVRFAHTDPAGIIFYPRYYEMLNQTIEEWQEHGIGTSIATLVLEKHMGIPTAHIDADFVAVSRLGEILTFALEVEKLGRSSCTVRVTCSCKGEVRVRFRQVLVLTSLETHRPVTWPDEWRQRIEQFRIVEAPVATS